MRPSLPCQERDKRHSRRKGPGCPAPKLAKVHPRWGTPYRITIGTTILVALLAGLVPLSALADLVSIGTLFAFIIVSLAVPVLRRRRPDVKRPFRVPFSPVLPAASALACLYLMTNLSVETWVRFAVWMVLGLAVYIFYGRRNARLATGAEPMEAEPVEA